jgi:hypothetical protein
MKHDLQNTTLITRTSPGKWRGNGFHDERQRSGVGEPASHGQPRQQEVERLQQEASQQGRHQVQEWQGCGRQGRQEPDLLMQRHCKLRYQWKD